MRLYRNFNHLPPKRAANSSIKSASFQTVPARYGRTVINDKRKLIQEIVKTRITEAQFKKGYEVKGDGAVILYVNENAK